MKDKTNKMKVRRIGRKRKALPPHTWEAHPTANHGEVNKTLIIAIITIVALVALAALLFFSDRFVGQAVFSPAGLNQAGIFVNPQDNNLSVGVVVEVPIKALLSQNQKSVAIDIKLNYNDNIFGLDCSDQEKENILSHLDRHFKQYDNYIIRNVTCYVNSIPQNKGTSFIKIQYAGLCSDDSCSNAISGSSEAVLASLKFTPKTPSPAALLKFEKLDIYNLDTGSIFALTKQDAVFNIVPATIDCVQQDLNSKLSDWSVRLLSLQDSITAINLLSDDFASYDQEKLLEVRTQLKGYITVLSGFSTLESTYSGCDLGKLNVMKTLVSKLINSAESLITEINLLLVTVPGTCTDVDLDNYCLEATAPSGKFANDCNDNDENTTVCTLPAICQQESCVIPPPQTGKISVTELAPVANVYKTKITALESFNNTEVTVYTVLYGNNSKVLVIKNEKIESGLLAGTEYVANVPYTGAVYNKSVIVYDKLSDQGQTVYGTLEVGYQNE